VARLQNVTTGAIVDVPDEKVDNLGPGWEPVKESGSGKSEPAKKPAAKRSTSPKK
jgi:hypothetical protein